VARDLGRRPQPRYDLRKQQGVRSILQRSPRAGRLPSTTTSRSGTACRGNSSCSTKSSVWSVGSSLLAKRRALRPHNSAPRPFVGAPLALRKTVAGERAKNSSHGRETGSVFSTCLTDSLRQNASRTSAQERIERMHPLEVQPNVVFVRDPNLPCSCSACCVTKRPHNASSTFT